MVHARDFTRPPSRLQGTRLVTSQRGHPRRLHLDRQPGLLLTRDGENRPYSFVQSLVQPALECLQRELEARASVDTLTRDLQLRDVLASGQWRDARFRTRAKVT